MSKGLRHIASDYERKETITRRINSGTKGLGYWAAIDAQKKMDKQAKLLKVESNG